MAKTQFKSKYQSDGKNLKNGTYNYNTNGEKICLFGHTVFKEVLVIFIPFFQILAKK